MILPAPLLVGNVRDLLSLGSPPRNKDVRYKLVMEVMEGALVLGSSSL